MSCQLMHNKAHRSGAMGALCLGSALGQKLFDGRPGGSGESSSGFGTGFLPPRLIEAVLRCRLSCQETVAPSPWFVFNVLHPDCVAALRQRSNAPADGNSQWTCSGDDVFARGTSCGLGWFGRRQMSPCHPAESEIHGGRHVTSYTRSSKQLVRSVRSCMVKSYGLLAW